jgi:hypothetical protein
MSSADLLLALAVLVSNGADDDAPPAPPSIPGEVAPIQAVVDDSGPCRLALLALRRAVDDVGDDEVALLGRVFAGALAENSGCEVVIAPACADDACVIATADGLGVAGVVGGALYAEDAAVVVAARLHHGVDGRILSTSRQRIDRELPSSGFAAAAVDLVRGIKAPRRAPPTPPVVVAEPVPVTEADPADEVIVATPTPTDRRPQLFGGVGVASAGALVAGAGAFVLGTALRQLGDDDPADDAAAGEELVLGGVVLGVGAAVVAAGAALIVAALGPAEASAP